MAGGESGGGTDIDDDPTVGDHAVDLREAEARRHGRAGHEARTAPVLLAQPAEIVGVATEAGQQMPDEGVFVGC